MKNYKDNLLGALYMLKTALEDYDTEIAHNILIAGGTDQTDEEMENDICEYLDKLDMIIKQTWLLEGNPMLISNNGKKLSK